MRKIEAFSIGIVSFLAGVAVGFLFAPKSGKDLRKDIFEATDEATNLYNDLQFSTLTEEEVDQELRQKPSR